MNTNKYYLFSDFILIAVLAASYCYASDVIYSNPKLFRVRHLTCTYNANITTLNHLELNTH
jgi:hypothetical protein